MRYLSVFIIGLIDHATDGIFLGSYLLTTRQNYQAIDDVPDLINYLLVIEPRRMMAR